MTFSKVFNTWNYKVNSRHIYLQEILMKKSLGKTWVLILYILTFAKGTWIKFWNKVIGNQTQKKISFEKRKKNTWMRLTYMYHGTFEKLHICYHVDWVRFFRKDFINPVIVSIWHCSLVNPRYLTDLKNRLSLPW